MYCIYYKMQFSAFSYHITAGEYDAFKPKTSCQKYVYTIWLIFSRNPSVDRQKIEKKESLLDEPVKTKVEKDVQIADND